MRPLDRWPPHEPLLMLHDDRTKGKVEREFIDFLKRIDAEVPHSLDIHIIMDNYAIHKTALIRSWLARRPHYHVHFTPTSASWINQIERWFAELTRKQIQRGVYNSVRQLEVDICTSSTC